MGLCTHLPDLACTVGCWLEDVGGKAIAAVGDREGGGKRWPHRCGWCVQSWWWWWFHCCWLGGVLHTWSGNSGCLVASDCPPLCFDDVGMEAVGCCNLAWSSHVPDPDWIAWLEWRKLSCCVWLVEDAVFLCWLPVWLWRYHGQVLQVSGTWEKWERGFLAFFP